MNHRIEQLQKAHAAEVASLKARIASHEREIEVLGGVVAVYPAENLDLLMGESFAAKGRGLQFKADPGDRDRRDRALLIVNGRRARMRLDPLVSVDFEYMCGRCGCTQPGDALGGCHLCMKGDLVRWDHFCNHPYVQTEAPA
jgi:hypothetical protein